MSFVAKDLQQIWIALAALATPGMWCSKVLKRGTQCRQKIEGMLCSEGSVVLLKVAQPDHEALNHIDDAR